MHHSLSKVISYWTVKLEWRVINERHHDYYVVFIIATLRSINFARHVPLIPRLGTNEPI